MQESLSMLHLPDIGLTEVLDIIILCGIIYYILRWIRQTRAWALLKGIVIVVLIAFVAYLFELVTVIWVVENALAMGLIALVILFQPELRKALEQLGRGVGAGLSTFSHQENKGAATSQSIDEITHAVVNMASRRVGALSCMERDVSLQEIADAGIPVDAAITRQLVLNVFAPMTPLHDGAMIIRGNRIVSAACILPLTAEDVDQELGTRHRAAIGLSEISDALVIVVSEETGTVSAASAGKLSRHLTEGELRELLSVGIEGGIKQRGRLIPWKNRKKWP
jgi:diadenylate cyclase